MRPLLRRYLGWTRPPRVDTYEASPQGSPLGASNVTLAPGRPDIVRIIDEVVSNYLSMYFAAPDRFGERLEAFVTELTDMLSEVSCLVDTGGDDGNRTHDPLLAKQVL